MGIPWSWSVALKIARYAAKDQADLDAMLAHEWKGVALSPQVLEDWLLNMCQGIGYYLYSADKYYRTKQRIYEVIDRVSSVPPVVQQTRASSRTSQRVRHGAPTIIENELSLPVDAGLLPISHNSSMSAVFDRIISKAQEREDDWTFERWKASGVPFEKCVHYCRTQPSGTKLANVVLCMMQNVCFPSSASCLALTFCLIDAG